MASDHDLLTSSNSYAILDSLVIPLRDILNIPQALYNALLKFC